MENLKLEDLKVTEKAKIIIKQFDNIYIFKNRYLNILVLDNSETYIW